MAIYIAIKDNVADVVDLKLTRGVRPNLPKYRFIGPYDTKGKAEKSLPVGVTYKGKVIGMEA